MCYLKRCEQAPAAAHFEETVISDAYLRQMFYFILSYFIQHCIYFEVEVWAQIKQTRYMSGGGGVGS